MGGGDAGGLPVLGGHAGKWLVRTCTRRTLRTEMREECGMAEQRTSDTTEHQMTRAGSDELGEAQAQRAGINFEWHFGRVTSLGVYEIANSRTVTILWEEGGVSNQQGEVTDEQWEIFKLAFLGSGRIAILSDQEDKLWMYDYRSRPSAGRASLPSACHMYWYPGG